MALQRGTIFINAITLSNNNSSIDGAVTGKYMSKKGNFRQVFEFSPDDGHNLGEAAMKEISAILYATPMTATALEILKSVYGYDAFRGPQAQIVEHVIAGNNAFVLMPTGGG